MNAFARYARLTLASALGALLVGCLFKPTTVTTRSFVLTPLAATERGPDTAAPLALGIGSVKMPSYLMRSSIAIRKGAGEIGYAESALWAEHLDQSFQRALAANLAALVPTDQIRLATWQDDEVTLAVQVSVDQFDVDSEGRGRLLAWWRITAPATDKLVRSGQSRLTRKGPPPQGQPQTLVTTLSELAADLSRELAQAIREAVAETQVKSGPPNSGK